MGLAESPADQAVLATIPADVVGIAAPRDGPQTLINISDLPDCRVKTPEQSAGYKLKISRGSAASPQNCGLIPARVDELSRQGAIDFLVKGVSIFKDTVTFHDN
ncbi:MAG: hypothetical protein VKI42_02305 [Synechococcaceae cyanobacterium]|nr:hypothetical protein [Synechococcaceae cyanobacterium]